MCTVDVFLCHTACSATETEIFLPPECKYVHNGELFDSFLRTTCDLKQCTTQSGECRDLDRHCCCRPMRTEPIDVECEGGIVSGLGISTNDTLCGCSVCDDVPIRVTVLVREPGEEGRVIPGAQVLDKSTGELLGLTYIDGRMSFTVPLGSRSISVIVQAANYLPREHMVQLIPTQIPIEVTVALLRRNPVPVTPGDSGYTFRLGDYVYITIHPGGFTRNGTVYNDVVMFDGIFMDPDDEGFLDMIDGDQFIIGDSYFSLSFMTYTFFSDPDGNELIAERVDYYIKVENPEQLQEEGFLVTFDQVTQEWVSLGPLTVSDSLGGKRQSSAIFLVQLDTALAQFIFHANLANISCWLQVRSFDDMGEPVQGLVAIVNQVGTRPDGMRFSYIFGTNTGAAQFLVNGLQDNAVCLPVACDGFERATVEGNILEDAGPLTPRAFPPDTFNASEIGAPARLGRFFTFQEVVTSTPNQLRPFFDSLASCMSAATVSNRDADDRNYFSFIFEEIVRVPNDSNCFIKIRVSECLRNPPNLLVLVDDNGIQNPITVDFEDLIDQSFSADHFLGPECIEAARIACVPFDCNTMFQVTVRDDTLFDFCNVSRIAPLVNNPLLLGSSSTFQSIVMRAEVLAEQDFNNPDLGIYYDPDEMVAEQICRNPFDSPFDSTGPNANIVNTAAMSGYAASFDCIL